jgi:glycosyltransferase involved in cell wall biosynthesis
MPAYNEEELLGETVEGVLPHVDRLVIVNDGSKDRTGEIADAWKAKHPDRVDVIHQENKGIGGAVLAAFDHLLARRDVDALGIIASDNQCDPALLPVFRYILEHYPDVDVAKGSRFLHRDTLHTMPRFRYWGNRGVTFALQLILGYHGMSDVLHGYLLGRRDVFERMDFSQIAQGYDLENTMMAEFRRLRCRFGLVPSPSRYGREQSKIVYSKQIPETLKRVARTFATRISSGPVTERLAPALLLAGNLPAAYLAMRLTSPEVRIFPACVPTAPLPKGTRI